MVLPSLWLDGEGAAAMTSTIAAVYARPQPPAEPTDLDLLEGKQPE